MKLYLKELFDVEEKQREFQYSIPCEDLKKEYPAYDFASPVSVTGRVGNHLGIVTLDMKVVFSLDHVCDRCLKEFVREYDYSFEHTLVRSGETDNDEYVSCKNNVLLLDELVMSDLLLQLPTKILCKEDCKGLCFTCGADLNEGDCGCESAQPS